MSNCIDIRPGSETVVFNKADFKPEFLVDVQYAKAHDPYREPSPAHNADQRTWQLNSMSWFLVAGDNVTETTDQIIIRLGHGRSTHTWRDFEGTCRNIASYFNKPVALRHRFYISDTGFDEPGQYGYFDVDFADLDKAFPAYVPQMKGQAK